MFYAGTESSLTLAYRVASIKHVYWDVRRPLRHIAITSRTCYDAYFPYHPHGQSVVPV